ncbi:MAG TPA: hypothetical protein VF859_03495 [Burkholderiales bacterium]
MKRITPVLAAAALVAAAAGVHAAQDPARPVCQKADKTIKAADRGACEKQGGKWKAAGQKSGVALPDDPFNKQAMPPDPLEKKALPSGAAGQRALPDDPLGKPGPAQQQIAPAAGK